MNRKEHQSRLLTAEESKEGDLELVEEVVKDNLEIMLEIIMIIREDAVFAKSIYANCPRLQHLLDSKPDLRPIFEDPNLVKINFEEVYRNAGGVLPEDHPSLFARTLACIVKHPLFKVFRILLLIKKCYSCVLGGGVSFIRSCLCALCTEGAAGEAADTLLGDDAEQRRRNGYDVDDHDNPEYESNKVALNNAADYMEGVWFCMWLLRLANLASIDPEVQERVNNILNSDPDRMDELIEADPELRALRDSNPLCAELMSEPDTMRILVEPDNLRALADAPELIEQDFANPDWSPPDVEQGVYDDDGRGATTTRGVGSYEQGDEGGLFEDYQQGDTGFSGMSAPQEEGGLFDGYEPGAAEGDAGDEIGLLDDYEPGEIDDDGGLLDDYEQGEVNEGAEVLLEDFEAEVDADNPDDEFDVDGTDDVEGADRKGKGANSRGKANKAKEKDTAEASRGGGGGGGFFASLGAGLVDYVAAETIGMTAGELVGNDGDFLATAEEEMLGGAEEAADEATGVVDEAEAQADEANATIAANAAALTEIATGDELAGNLEDTLDTVEEAQDRHDATTTTTRSKPSYGEIIDLDAAIEAEEAAQASPVKRGGIFGAGASYFAALNTAAKEYVAGNILGDDLGELLVERMEEGGEDDEAEDVVAGPTTSRKPTVKSGHSETEIEI